MSEDRRERIEQIRDDAHKADCISGSDAEFLLAELSRLSRVEQALREALRKFAGAYNRTTDAAAAANAGAELAHDVDLALSASPEAQPKERHE